MTTHTPGPWQYQEEADDYTHIVRAQGNVFITQLAQDRTGQSEADARLIAAAPELLEACKAAKLALRATSQREKDYSHELGLLNSAIAKAEGPHAQA